MSSNLRVSWMHHDLRAEFSIGLPLRGPAYPLMLLTAALLPLLVEETQLLLWSSKFTNLQSYEIVWTGASITGSLHIGRGVKLMAVTLGLAFSAGPSIEQGVWFVCAEWDP
jgi:hypothetical protein